MKNKRKQLKPTSNIKTRDATRCNNHDGLPNLSFIIKKSVVSEVYLEPS